MKVDLCVYQFQLDNLFFANIDGLEVQKGKVDVVLTVKKTTKAFELDFQISGIVLVPCDRCLDEIEQPVSSSNTLFVKFGTSFAEEGDNIVIVPVEEGYINVAWFMYEFIALSIPIKHVHAPGKCNKAMIGKLNKHLKTVSDDDNMSDTTEPIEEEIGDIEEQTIDPRWDELKKILDNN